jgi:hypothetical protein
MRTTIKISWYVAAIVGLLGGTAVARAAGHVDLSGVWQVIGRHVQLKTTIGQTPPLNPQAASTYALNAAKWRAGDLSFDPTAKCVSPGLPRIMTLPYPFKIFQSGTLVFFLFHWNHWFRYVEVTDKSQQVPYPMSMGVARGRWEHNVFIIDTVGLRADNTYLDSAGMPRSEDMRIEERLVLKNSGRLLEDKITIDDLKTFDRAWETVLEFRKLPDGMDIKEDVCLDRVDAGQPAVDWQEHGE